MDQQVDQHEKALLRASFLILKIRLWEGCYPAGGEKGPFFIIAGKRAFLGVWGSKGIAKQAPNAPQRFLRGKGQYIIPFLDTVA